MVLRRWILLVGFVCGISFGFLEDELPLSIVTTTPSNLIQTSDQISSSYTEQGFPSIPVSGQQAITIVFSRPVIALGTDFGQQILPSHKVPFSFSTSEVRGSFRWVTTYIARWDPEGEWPSDLEVDLVWNEALTTWDDGPVNLTDVPERATLVTPSLSFEVIDVDSEQARNLTDGEWGPYSTENLDSTEPEIPPDGVITVSFDYPVDLTLLNSSFVVMQDGQETNISALVFPCEDLIEQESDTCAKVMLDGDLEVGGSYTLVLPQGAKYHPLSGPKQSASQFDFFGLREFRIPFYRQNYLPEDLKDAEKSGLEFRRFDLYLVHGLAESVTLEDLKNLISLQKVPFDFNGTIDSNTESLDFGLELINKGRLQLTARVEPATKYVISMQESADIKDGFGLPLKQPLYLNDEFDDDFLVFSMKELSEVHETFRPNVVFEDVDGKEYQWPFFSRKTGSEWGSISAWAVTEDNLMDVLVGLYSYNGYGFDRTINMTEYIGEADFYIDASKDPLILDISDIGTEDLFSESGAFITQQCCKQNLRPQKAKIDAEEAHPLFKTSLNFVNLQFGYKFYIFITDMQTGLPLENVSTQLFLMGEYEAGKNPQLLTESASDETGTAVLDLKDFMEGYDNLTHDWLYEFVVVMKTANGTIFFDTVFAPDKLDFGDSVWVTTVKDRELVRPGETLKIKGYVRNEDMGEFRVARNLSVSGIIYPQFVEVEEEDEGTALDSVVDQQFGSFVMEVSIPKNSRLQEYSMSIYGNGQYVATEYFTVADPRPPTATLDLKVVDWVKPNGTVDIDVQATSLIGATVQTEMTLTWTINDIQGVDKITTNVSGYGTYSLDLSQYGNVTSDAELEIQVEWIGPTRERITNDVTVPIKLSDKKVSIASSLSTNLPGIQFQIQSTISGPNSNETILYIYSKNITDFQKMYDGELNEDSVDFIGSQYGLSDLDYLFEVVGNDCDIEKGCVYALPDFGQYLIAACFEEDNDLICNGIFRGKTFQNWTDNPLNSHLALSATKQYSDGDEIAEFLIDIPYENVEGLIVWGNQLEIKTQRKSFDIGVQLIEIEIGDECVGRCEINIVLTIPRQNMDTMQPFVVPTSKLFDPAAPHTEVLKFSLTKTVTPKDLRVEVSVEDDVVEPGQNTTISVQVFDCSVDGSECEVPSNNTEVTIIAVDKSILEALPYSPTLKKFIINLMMYSTTYSIANLIAPDAIDNTLAFIQQIQHIDPFVPFDFDLTPSTASQQVDGMIDEYLSKFKTDLTTFAKNSQYFLEDYGYGLQFESALAGVSRGQQFGRTGVAKDGIIEEVQAGSKPTSSMVSVRTQDDFVTTPLFAVFKTTTEGTGEVTFSAPGNLGTFVVRAYAMSSGIQNGQGETELIVRRGVSLAAALPRGVRVGDEFQAGAVITVTGGQIADVDVTVTISVESDPSPLTVDGDFTEIVKTAADGTVEVTFPFTANTIGEADLKITVEIEDGGADALQVSFPVEGVQDPVIVASSFAVQGTQSGGQSGWTEGLQLPNALPGSGSVDLLAGVGRLPAIQTIATVLFKNPPYFTTPQAYNALANLLVKPILDVYGVTDTELYTNATQKFEECLLNLTVGNLTLDKDIGLMYYERSDVKDANVYLNAYAAFIGTQILALYNEKVMSLNAISAEQKMEITRLVELWRKAAEKQLIEDATVRKGSYSSLTTIALVRYLRADGLTWHPQVAEQIAEDLSLQRLIDNVDDLSVEGAAYLALLLLRDQDRAEVQDILDRFTSGTRVGGRTAYISYSPSSAYPVPTYDQGMALITYSQAQTFNALVEKLANYLGGPLNNNGVASSYLGDQASAAVMLALAQYDTQKGSTEPNLVLTAVSGNYSLLEATFDDASDLPVETSTPWEALDSPPAPIDVKAEGVGEATVAAILDFTPKNLITFPVYRGFHVTSIIQKADPITQAPTGPPLTKVPLGTVVAVTVQVVTPDRYSESQVRVLMPGGLEPIDPNLDADAESCFLPWLRGFSQSRGFRWFPSWWCPQQETRPQVVTFDLTRIGPGASEFNVLAIAATRGRFVLPSVKAFVVEEPEILGLSAAGYFEVCDDCGAESIEDVISPALECPNDCSGLGVCDVATGTCECNDGFLGDDCSAFAEQ